MQSVIHKLSFPAAGFFAASKSSKKYVEPQDELM